MKNRILVTGSRSGFGLYAATQLGATGLTRENADAILAENSATNFDVILHCANDDKNSLLLNRLLHLAHRHFVFISSTDVYPDDDLLHRESDNLDVQHARSAYAEEKILTEKSVLCSASRPLIIRTSGLLGEGSFSSNLKLLLADDSPKLTLTRDSSWNFVTHKELLTAVQVLTSKSMEGPINFCRSESVTIESVANYLKKTPAYGNFRYRVGKVNNRLAASIFPELELSSLDVLKKWLATRQSG